MPWVIPGGCAVVVIHKEGPSCLRVNFYFPPERERLVVVTRHGQNRRRRIMRLHAVHVARYCRVLATETFYIQATDALKIPLSDVEKWAGSFWK